MSRILSANSLRELFAQWSTEEFIVLLTMTEPSATEVKRLCSSATDVISRGETFISFPFDLTLPPEGDQSGNALGRLAVDNVSREITLWIEALADSPQVDIEIVSRTTPDIVEASWPGFEFAFSQWDQFFVEGQLGYDFGSTTAYPEGTMNPADFRAIL